MPSLHIHVVDENTLIYQTHCWYTKQGQVIVLRRLPDGAGIYFDDVSRGIRGVFTHIETLPFAIGRGGTRATVELCQNAYLMNRYEYADHRHLPYATQHELAAMAKEKASLVPPVRRGQSLI